MALKREHWISLEEYYEIERSSESKYEYSDGHIYDMSGGTFEHSQIAVNLSAILNAHLYGKVCRVANSDMKVLPLGAENPSYFPDITVTCNPDDYKRGSIAIRSPRLIFEVLSPSTASRDRTEKLRVYQACPSLEEYVMVSSHHQEVEVYHREGEDKWTLTRYRHGQVVILASVDLMLPIAEIYAQTDLPPIASVLSTD
jgi:Uma2 family endonuclease